MMDMPAMGIASWNIAAPTLCDRVKWIVDNGFTGISLHAGIVDGDEADRQNACAAVRDAGLCVTFHGIIGYDQAGIIDLARFDRLMDEVLWWHERTGAVHCFCYDPMYMPTESGGKTMDWDANRRAVQLTHARLGPYGIRTGIENTYGGDEKYRSIAQIQHFKDLCDMPRLGMLLDAAHANIHVRSDGVEGESGVGDYVRALPLEVVEVHFSDNHGETDEHLPVGAGNLDLAAVMGALSDTGFCGQLTVEVCPGLKSCRLDSPEEMAQIQSTRDAVRSAWIAAQDGCPPRV